MIPKRAITALAFFLTISVLGYSAEKPRVEVLKGSGGTIKTPLSQNIVLNDKSSLQREWITISDKTLPVIFSGLSGITTKYESGDRYSSGNYIYTSTYKIICAEPITALEVRFIAFDVWGKTIKSLLSTEIEDFGVGTHSITSKWNLFSENEASHFYASIAYVYRVRTKAGKVFEANPGVVLEQARLLNSKFEAGELEPEKPAKK
jgi:hypothetical protein